MLVPLTFIIDITLTKYGVVVNNGYGILCVILEKSLLYSRAISDKFLRIRDMLSIVPARHFS